MRGALVGSFGRCGPSRWAGSFLHFQICLPFLQLVFTRHDEDGTNARGPSVDILLSDHVIAISKLDLDFVVWWLAFSN